MTTLITVTNNYFQDLATYINAAGLPKNTKLKKAALYEEIETYNRVEAEELAAVQAELNAVMPQFPSNTVEVTEDNSFDNLYANWQQAKTDKAVKKEKLVQAEPEWTAADDFEISKFQGMKDRTGRALIVHHLRQTHSAKTIAAKAGISDRDVARKTNAVNIYHASERMRQIVNILTPWGRFETAIGIMSMTKNSLDDLCDRALKLRSIA